MRGITPIIAIILLLMITIAITGLAFVFLSGTTESAAQAGEAQLEQQTQLIGESFAIEIIDKNKVIIRNRGATELKNMKFYVDGKEVNITQGPSSIPINQLGTFVLNLSENTNPNALKISSLGSKTEQSVSGIMFNPCASDSDCSTPPQISCVNSSSTLRNYSSQGVCGSDGKCAYTPIDTQCGTNRCTLIDNSYDCLRPSCGGDARTCSSITSSQYCECLNSREYVQSVCTYYTECGLSCQGTATPCQDISNYNSCLQQEDCSWANPYCTGSLSCSQIADQTTCEDSEINSLCSGNPSIGDNCCSWSGTCNDIGYGVTLKCEAISSSSVCQPAGCTWTGP